MALAASRLNLGAAVHDGCRLVSAVNRNVPERRAVKQALRELGLSDRQVRALLSGGWKSLVGERDAEVEELKEALADMCASLVE